MIYKELTLNERRRFKTRANCMFCHQPISEFEMFNYCKVPYGKFTGYIWWHLKCQEQYLSNQLETSSVMED